MADRESKGSKQVKVVKKQDGRVVARGEYRGKTAEGHYRVTERGRSVPFTYLSNVYKIVEDDS